MAEGDAEAPLPPEKPRVSIKDQLMPPDGDGVPKESPRTKAGINYTAAFVMVAAGVASLAEISRAWKIPYEKLAHRSTQEKWGSLIKRYAHIFQQQKPEQKPPDEAELKARAEKIQKNRDKIITPAHAILQHIQKILDDNKDTGLDTETIVDLARAVKMLGEITMVASGDEYAVRHLAAGGSGGQQPKDRERGPLIQINMPSIIAGPRRVKAIGETIQKLTTELAGEQAAPDPEEDEGDLNAEERPPEAPEPVEVVATLSDEEKSPDARP